MVHKLVKIVDLGIGPSPAWAALMSKSRVGAREASTLLIRTARLLKAAEVQRSLAWALCRALPICFCFCLTVTQILHRRTKENQKHTNPAPSDQGKTRTVHEKNIDSSWSLGALQHHIGTMCTADPRKQWLQKGFTTAIHLQRFTYKNTWVEGQAVG